MKEIEGAELRLAPYETAYVINLTGNRGGSNLDRIIRKDTAVTESFETSVSCIGASICQVGLRDSQGLLAGLCEEGERSRYCRMEHCRRSIFPAVLPPAEPIRQVLWDFEGLL